MSTDRLGARSLGAVVIALLVTSGPAWAGPSGRDFDEFFSYFALEGRGFVGVSTALNQGPVWGGDAHLLFEAPGFALLVGTRAGGDRSTQFIGVDGGLRVFFNRAATAGMFLGGGVMGGAEYVGAFGFSTGSLFAGYVEWGYELPRTFPLRLNASLRVDVGGTSARDISRIIPADPFTLASLNIGIFFGGASTRASADAGPSS